MNKERHKTNIIDCDSKKHVQIFNSFWYTYSWHSKPTNDRSNSGNLFLGRSV